MSEEQGLTLLPELEEMDTEQFLAWMLSSCEIEEADYPVIRRDVQSCMLSRLLGQCFDIVEVEKSFPNIHAWLESTRPEVRHDEA